MSQPLITVITPVYKAEEYLDECIKSILAQTHKNLELILIDDGSPDRSGVMCDEWASRDNRIKVIHKANGGASSARNMALDIARGEYVTCVDADDYIEPNSLERLLERMTDDIGIVIGGMYEFDKSSREMKRYDLQTRHGFLNERLIEGKDFIEGLLIKFDIDPTTCGKLYRKDLFEDLRFFVGRSTEDTRMLYFMGKKMATTGQKTLILNDAYYYRRYLQDSVSHSKTRPMVLDLLLNLDDIVQDSKSSDYDKSDSLERMLNEKVIDLHNYIFTSKEVHSRYHKEIIRMLRRIPNKYYIERKMKGTCGLAWLKSIAYLYMVKYLTPLHSLIIQRGNK